MSPETVTPAETALRPAPGRQTPLPEWVSTTDRNALPPVLYWANEAECPLIQGQVDVISSGFALGTAIVTGYFHTNGELGCWVELDIPLASGERRTFYFGESLTRLDQGDEPTGAPALSPGVQNVTVSKDETPAPAAAAAPAVEVEEEAPDVDDGAPALSVREEDQDDLG